MYPSHTHLIPHPYPTPDPAATPKMSIPVKTYSEDGSIRRFRVGSHISATELFAVVSKIDATPVTTLHWKDDDGDFVTIKADADLAEAIGCLHGAGATLRLYVNRGRNGTPRTAMGATADPTDATAADNDGNFDDRPSVAVDLLASVFDAAQIQESPNEPGHHGMNNHAAGSSSRSPLSQPEHPGKANLCNAALPPPPPPLVVVVVGAFYGTGKPESPHWRGADVLGKVAALVEDGALSVLASNAVFGDPLHGVRKQLTVTYRIADGPAQTKTVWEGQPLQICASDDELKPEARCEAEPKSRPTSPAPAPAALSLSGGDRECFNCGGQGHNLCDCPGTVKVGSWTGRRGPKLVKLPAHGLEVSRVPINRQQPGWKDEFRVEVVGDTLKVFRTDIDGGGWGQQLELGYRAAASQPPPDAPASEPESAPETVLMTTLCTATLDRIKREEEECWSLYEAAAAASPATAAATAAETAVDEDAPGVTRDAAEMVASSGTHVYTEQLKSLADMGFAGGNEQFLVEMLKHADGSVADVVATLLG